MKRWYFHLVLCLCVVGLAVSAWAINIWGMIGSVLLFMTTYVCLLAYDYENPKGRPQK